MSSSPLNFHLDHYDGPLDLLLDLIRKQQIESKDIPIATITSQYLAYLDKAREMDLDIGAEFVSVRSNINREESHPFYRKLGYELKKTQQVYRKRL